MFTNRRVLAGAIVAAVVAAGVTAAVVVSHNRHVDVVVADPDVDNPADLIASVELEAVVDAVDALTTDGVLTTDQADAFIAAWVAAPGTDVVTALTADGTLNDTAAAALRAALASAAKETEAQVTSAFNTAVRVAALIDFGTSAAGIAPAEIAEDDFAAVIAGLDLNVTRDGAVVTLRDSTETVQILLAGTVGGKSTTAVIAKPKR